VGCEKKNSPPSAPGSPYPEDGAKDLSEYLTLSWASTDRDGDILGFDIYFGTDSIPPLVEENNIDGFYKTPGLSLGTIYYWNVIVHDGAGNQTEGPVWNFTTKFPVLEKGTLIDSRDGQFYGTIKIGDQWWMSENINYETVDGSWCFNDMSSFCTKMGKLYNWNAAREVCPDGWHLPTNYDWFILTNYLGGAGIAGGKLKQENFMSWQPPNTAATNSSGFTALPGGYRYSEFEFALYGRFAYFWTSSSENSNNAWAYYLYYKQAEIDKNFYSKEYGFSVRCLKD